MLSAVCSGKITTNRYQEKTSTTLIDSMQHMSDYERSKRTARDVIFLVAMVNETIRCNNVQ